MTETVTKYIWLYIDPFGGQMAAFIMIVSGLSLTVGGILIYAYTEYQKMRGF